MSDETEKIRIEVSQLEQNFKVMVEFFRQQIKQKTIERNKLRQQLYSIQNRNPNSEPLLLDDTIGALTRSVYDASAGTEAAFVKMLNRLTDLTHVGDKYVSDLSRHSTEMRVGLQMAKLMTKEALELSKRITNGVSDQFSADVLGRIIKFINKSNTHVITAIKEKNYLKDTLHDSGSTLGAIGNKISGGTQKGFALVSVAQKICQNAKAIQDLSKSVVDRAERQHLAKAAPEFDSAVSNIKKVLAIEQKIFPVKVRPVEEVVPSKIDRALDDAYQSNERAIRMAQKASEFSGAARTQDVVRFRDELRTALDHEQDALDWKNRTTDPVVTEKILPETANRYLVVNQQLVPEIHNFREINNKILSIVDGNRSIQIDENISKLVNAKQSGLGIEVSLYVGGGIKTRQRFFDFL